MFGLFNKSPGVARTNEEYLPKIEALARAKDSALARAQAEAAQGYYHFQHIDNQDINTTEPDERPRDSVSCISWTPSGTKPVFATSDWDSWIRIYNLDPEASILKQKGCFTTESPCLSVNWHHDERKVFAGCTDGSVKSIDTETGMLDVIGRHEGPVKSVHWLSEANALLTLSFDKTLRIWDPRQGAKHVAGFQLLYRPLCSDLVDSYLAIGMSQGRLMIFDIREIQSEMTAEHPNYMLSSLGPQIQMTSIKLFRSGEFGVAVGDNFGRCNVLTFERNPTNHPLSVSLTSVVTFKAHKIQEPQLAAAFPLNSLGFHPNNQCVYTAGGDGKMCFWDWKAKDKTAQFYFKDTTVTRAEMDPTGKFLAYSLGYDWSRGIQDHMTQPSKVCAHVMKDQELEKH